MDIDWSDVARTCYELGERENPDLATAERVCQWIATHSYLPPFEKIVPKNQDVCVLALHGQIPKRFDPHSERDAYAVAVLSLQDIELPESVASDYATGLVKAQPRLFINDIYFIALSHALKTVEYQLDSTHLWEPFKYVQGSFRPCHYAYIACINKEDRPPLHITIRNMFILSREEESFDLNDEWTFIDAAKRIIDWFPKFTMDYSHDPSLCFALLDHVHKLDDVIEPVFDLNAFSALLLLKRKLPIKDDTVFFDCDSFPLSMHAAVHATFVAAFEKYESIVTKEKRMRWKA